MTGTLAAHGTVDRGTFGLHLDVDVPPGAVLGVLGPNGAGKTTLLRAVAGLTRVSTGSVALGDDVYDAPAAGVYIPAEKRAVSYVFQDYRLFPHLTVTDNVAFAARSRGAGRSPSRATARRWLDRLGLTDVAGHRPSQLSGGLAQRVALARALAAGPRVLLLDEPLAALDARTRADVRTELRLHLADFSGACLLVTHDPLDALILADRLLVLEDGRVTQQGRPADVARRPATPYVASLVGLNLYRGRVDAAGDVQLDTGTRMRVASAPRPGPVLLAIRPSAIAVHTDRPRQASPRNVWPGVVSDVELLTDRVRLRVDGNPAALVDVTAAAVAELHLVPGAQVWLAVKSTEIDVY